MFADSFALHTALPVNEYAGVGEDVGAGVDESVGAGVGEGSAGVSETIDTAGDTGCTIGLLSAEHEHIKIKRRMYETVHPPFTKPAFALF